MQINRICSLIIYIVIGSGLKLYSQEVFSFATSSVYNTLVWSDEFETDGSIDTDKWFHQTQLPTGNSWYNGEIQHYTNRTVNTFVEGGILKLVAKRETFTDQGVTKSFTSARLNSKFAFTYGRIEIRAKLPSGNGTWPALWMLGKNIKENGAYWYNLGYGTTSWPDCGEVDIMEHWGSNQNYISSAMHTRSSFGGTVNKGGQVISTASTDFHVYALDWTAEKMVFSVDGNIHYTYNPAIKDAQTWPFDSDQYILMNLAILPQIEASFMEGALEVDYVRVFQNSQTSLRSIKDEVKFSIFPNPTDGILNINHPARIADVTIFDIGGKHVLKMDSYPMNKPVDVSSLTKGLYILQVKSEVSVKSVRFNKN